MPQLDSVPFRIDDVAEVAILGMLSVLSSVAVRLELGQHCIEISNPKIEAVRCRRFAGFVRFVRVDTPHVVSATRVVWMCEGEEATPPLLRAD